MNAGTVDNVGTLKLKMLVMVSIKEFPRGINSDQVISANKRDGGMKVRAPGPGLKRQASSFRTNLFKHQATSHKP